MIDPIIYNSIPTIDVNDLIKIRPMRIEDAPDYLQYMRNPEVRKYVLVEKQLTIAYAMSHINYCNDMMRARQGIFWAICTKNDDKMIGWLALYTNNPDQRAEIAFDLDEDFWGQGIITDVISSTLRYAFDHMNLIRVSAIVLPDNTASAKTLEKNHFRLECTMKNYKFFRDQCYDVMQFAITKEEFQKHR